MPNILKECQAKHPEADLHAYLAQTPCVCRDDGEPSSVTPSRHQDEGNIGVEKKAEREEEIRQILQAEEHTFTSGFLTGRKRLKSNT